MLKQQQVRAHKMGQEFHDDPILYFMALVDEDGFLVSLRHSNGEQFIRLENTNQWLLGSTSQRYFIDTGVFN